MVAIDNPFTVSTESFVMKVLETERLIIRHLRPDDLEAFSEICADPEIMRYVGDGNPIDREQTRKWIEKSGENYSKHGFGCMAVEAKENGRLIGYCGLVNPTPEGEAEIIYAFKQDYWGRGLASEAARAMIDFGVGPCALKRIVATIAPENVSSIRIVEKWGMSLQEERLDEHGLPEVVYVIEDPRH